MGRPSLIWEEEMRLSHYLNTREIIRELGVGIAGWLCWQGFILLDIYLAKLNAPFQAFLVIVSQIILLYLLTILGVVYTGEWGFMNLPFLILPVGVMILHAHGALNTKHWAHLMVVGGDIFWAGIFCWGLRKTQWCLGRETRALVSIVRWLRQGILCVLAVVAIWYYLYI